MTGLGVGLSVGLCVREGIAGPSVVVRPGEALDMVGCSVLESPFDG